MKFSLIILILLSLLGFSKLVAAKTYVLGVVPQQSPLILYQKWKPVVDYLSARTGLKIEFRTEKSISKFEEVLYSGGYDLAYINPYHYIVANNKQNYQAVVRREKDIKGILVAPKHADKTLISQNSTFLFPSPNAFAATLVMKYELIEQFGLDLYQHNNFKYVNSHDSVYKGIARNFGDLGGGVQRTFKNFNSAADKDKLAILHVTKGYPSHPIAFKSSISESDQALLLDALLAMPTEILNSLSMNKIKQVDDAEYDVIRKLSDRLAIKEN